MPVRPSVRFDVFKRDSFTCSYCGRRPPDVTLEVDHIIPVAEGGSDDAENLTTACWDCNRGKGATPLDVEPSTIPDLAERTAQLKEREEQLRAYHQLKAEQAQRRDADFDRVWRYWFDVWGAEKLPRYHTPWEATLAKYIDLLGPDDVMAAMDITAQKFSWVSANAVRYLVGVLKGKHAEATGMRTKCIVCGKWINLEAGEDPNLDWYHASCEPKVG